MEKLSYKGFCWSVGTTSFRTEQFNYKIEQQLILLDKFMSDKVNADKIWNPELQEKYYYYLKENGFLTGTANNPAKDAREKTAGLKALGLIYDNRRLTDVGKKLKEISLKHDFKSDNIFELSKDSFIYFKQLLKCSYNVDGEIIRPFIIFLILIGELNYLTKEEFMYAMPLCINQDTTEKIIQFIKETRNDNRSYDKMILSILLNMENYKKGLQLISSENITIDLISNIGMNRKSYKYDLPYYDVYLNLLDVALKHEYYKVSLLLESINKLKLKALWRKYIFKSTTKRLLQREPQKTLNLIEPIFLVKNEKEYREEFFKLMHLLKAKSTLEDYFDLNRRYFKATDIVIFEDNKIYLDLLPQCYLETIKDNLYLVAYKESNMLYNDTDLQYINESFKIDKESIYKKLSLKLGVKIKNKSQAEIIIKKEKYEKFNKIIKNKFKTENLIEILELLEKRDDDKLFKMVTDNADAPTIFEYILAIIWYKISGFNGDVLDYMNLYKDANLLPITHAGGGEADILWKYNKTNKYPEHVLLIEATLANGVNQRRMEMEPVSRHLGDYIINNGDNVYCTFVSTFLDNNVISDFRGRKVSYYYDRNNENNYIYGMNIIPIDTHLLKIILKKNISYDELYYIFKNAYEKDLNEHPKLWHNNLIKQIEEYV